MAEISGSVRAILKVGLYVPEIASASTLGSEKNGRLREAEPVRCFL